MMSTPAQPTFSTRAAGKARASDVGIRSRMTQVQAQVQVAQRRAALAVRQPTTVSPHQLHRRSPSASAVLDFCPSEYRETTASQQRGELAGPVSKPNVKGRPSDVDLRHGTMYVNWVQKAVLARLSHIPLMDVPPEEESEYRGMYNVLWTHIAEMEPLLPLYACWMAEDTIKQLVTANAVVKQQKLYLASESPRFIIDLQTVTLFTRQIEKLKEAIAERQRAMQRQAAEHGQK
ncbi:uncharacterized protein C8Q71DRAFT_111899 [Rhodofomes roseus]|uniref:Uncharacterized protein n=1 Tax=Rhodofomes roseus TaxID=34475 RepID=A0ABQ8KCJ6_9APHY|nr:uncharacterized protein C8Q71DRAFT_111899 [Rhodofomes roseus]KAH9835288.1 hypothetical protein C8Q71DRAFT_111899 [Rhodofomes roseus]